MILSSMVGNNDVLIKQVAELYLAPGMVVADVTHAKGVFWKKIDTTQFDFRPTDLATGTDMRNLPYEDESIDVVVVDPPYMYNPKATIKASIADCYNVNNTAGLKTTEDILQLYIDGIREAYRVIKPKGLCWVKCKDGIESGKQKWEHIRIFNDATAIGFYPKDLFILQQVSTPASRWKHQLHARKNHSYLWIFQK